jgi:hypothetical protein
MRFKQLGQIFHHAPYVGGGIMAWPYHGMFRPRESFLHGIWLVQEKCDQDYESAIAKQEADFERGCEAALMWHLPEE